MPEKEIMDARKISEVTLDINNLFGLDEQTKAFVSLVAKSVKSRNVCLLFLDSIGERFTVASCKPVSRNNRLSGLIVHAQNPVIDQLLKTQGPITRDTPAAESIIEGLFSDDDHNIAPGDVEIILPLISSGRLIGILLFEGRESGRYTPEEIKMLKDISSRLAPGLEKEYLRGQLDERKNELTILNRCSSILSSSLYIQDVYQPFVSELKRIVDLEWTALILIESKSLYVLALYSEIGSNWQTGDRMPMQGTATEWVAASRLPLVESDLKKDSLFVTDVYHRKQGIRSIVCVPLIIYDERVIGSLIIANRKPNAYSPRQVEFLRELALQISRPIENSQLFEEVLKKSRYDELTGLLNRRSMDEQIISEVNRHSRYGGVFSIILLDLDSMKKINDQYGHLAGDGLLSRTGVILQKSVRSVDQAFRYGGDEFAILLPNTPVSAAVRVAERVRKQLAAKLVVDDMTVTASVGLASWPANGTEANDIVAAADAALYKAKNEGGNRSYLDETAV